MTALYIEAPTDWGLQDLTSHHRGDQGVFLAGGITGAPDWQAEIVALLDDTDFVLLNPRRANFPIDDPNAAMEQILWEHVHFRRAARILFWFPAESAGGCPIALYELGAWSMTAAPLAVGVEPGYPREQDVRIQTKLARPDVQVVQTLPALARAIIAAKPGRGYLGKR